MPAWSENNGQTWHIGKRPVFHDDGKMIWHLSISFNLGIRRYLLTKPHFAEGDKRWQDVASLGIFDAPQP